MTFDFKATCTKCNRETAGRLQLDERMKVTDSDGGLLFNDGWRCHSCLGQPWLSADVAVGL